MNRILMSLILILSTTTAWAGQAGNPPKTSSAPKQSIPEPLPLGAVKNRPVIEGCTCEFQQPSARVKGLSDAVFISAIGWEQAWIHVGQDIPLKKVSETGKISNRRGQKAKVQFAGPGDLNAVLDLTVEGVCPPSEPCDTTGLEGTMSVNRGAQKATTVITGSCGC